MAGGLRTLIDRVIIVRVSAELEREDGKISKSSNYFSVHGPVAHGMRANREPDPCG